MLGTVFGKILSPAMPYLLGGAVVAVMTLGGLYYWKSSQYDKLAIDAAGKIERAENKANQLNQTVTEQQNTIQAMIEAQKQEYALIEARNGELAVLQNSLDEERRQNEDYKRRWETIALKKPGLLAGRINLATAERVRRIAVATCRIGCDKDN